MNQNSIKLGRILGIPVGLDYSWFLIFALLTWSFATGYYPTEFQNWSPVQYWVVGAVTALLLFVCVLLHELGHSVVALRYKIPVRDINLYIFGGISQLSAEPTSAVSEFWITISGPIVSFALALGFGVLALVFSSLAPLLALFKYLAYINLILGVFNLIPGFPLDGGGVLMSIVWGITHSRRKAILIASAVGSVFAYLFIVAGVFLIFTGNLINGLWIAFIGWFLISASRGQVQQEKIKDLLTGHKTSEAMSNSYTIIQPETTLQSLVDDHILGGSRRSFIVEDGSEVIGMLTMHQLNKIPRDRWSTTTVSQVIIPTEQVKQVQLDTGLWDAIQEMDRDGVNQLPVLDGGQIQGILSREDVISYLRKLEELQR
ncbi:MAG: site-2 protease family protein [Chloroflexi bacterium]|nr:site-2 protease family protein [Chloroflexota bacterium]